MSTRLQKKLAKAIVEDAKNKRPTVAKDLLESIGYSKATAKGIAKDIIEAPGVVKELNELGFSEDGAKKVVAKILYSESAKDHDKLDAADKIFKVHGSYAPDKHINLNLNEEPSPEIKDLAAKVNELYRSASSGSDGALSGSMGDQAQDKE